VLSPLAQEHLLKLYGDDVIKLYTESYDSLNFHFIKSGQSFKAPFKMGQARRVNRVELNEFMLASAGANVISPARFLSFADKGDHVEVTVGTKAGQKNFITRVLIGADGADSIVRRALYPHLIPPAFSALRTVHRIIDFPLAPAQIHLWPEPSLGLMAWAHVIEKERLVLGVLRQEGDSVSDLHDTFVQKLELNHGVRLAPPEETSDGRVNIGPAIMNRYTPGKGRVILTGEAAGLLNPPLEGISVALTSASTAAKAVAKALNNNTQPALAYRAMLGSVARHCTDMWNPTRLLFSSPHEADIRAGFNALSQDAQHASGNDLMAYMRQKLKPLGWFSRSLWLGLIRFLTGRYPSRHWL
jgi:flavin-dependent dehydrogenase